jgi:hypothetical protein
MARMYPATLPASTTSAAEDRLFHEFRTQLPHDWIVMHGVTWLNRRKQKDYRGEADFLIIHPLRGLLVLEVKGGRIEGEWSAENWTSTDRFGDVHLIKNPVKQVTGAMYDLRTKIKDAPATRPFTYPSYCGIAVPDVLASKQPFGVDWQRDLVIDSSDLPRLVEALEGMFSPEPPPDPMPKAAIDALVALLQPTVNLTRLGLVAEMRTGEQKILELSTYQSYALAMLRMHRRAVINGCAGSGKTMLAIEKAIQLAEEGFSVVLTCFNKPLAGWMQLVIDRQPSAVRDLIRVGTYHDLAVKLCAEAGRPSTVLAGDPQLLGRHAARSPDGGYPGTVGTVRRDRGGRRAGYPRQLVDYAGVTAQRSGRRCALHLPGSPPGDLSPQRRPADYDTATGPALTTTAPRSAFTSRW